MKMEKVTIDTLVQKYGESEGGYFRFSATNKAVASGNLKDVIMLDYARARVILGLPRHREGWSVAGEVMEVKNKLREVGGLSPITEEEWALTSARN